MNEQTGQAPADDQKISQIAEEVIELIVESVNLRHLDRSKITLDTVLTKTGLGLDSIDILEVVVAVEHRFGVKLKDPAHGQKHFGTIGAIARFVISGGNA